MFMLTCQIESMDNNSFQAQKFKYKDTKDKFKKYSFYATF